MNISAETFSSIVESLRSDRGNGRSDKRRQPRVGLCGRATIRTGDGRFRSAFVRDLSREGVGLVFSAEQTPRGRFTLCFAAEAGAARCQGMLSEIVRATRIESGLYRSARSSSSRSPCR